MVTFVGTKTDFKKYFNGYFKNEVNAITKSDRRSCHCVCEYCCNKVKELDSAHIHGFERDVIISNLLNDYEQPDGNVNVDMKEFDKRFVSIHQPVRLHFYFLCKKCHREYDKNLLADEAIKEKVREKLEKFILQLKGNGENNNSK